MGGEKLKIPVLALLLLGAGLIIPFTIIPAQEAAQTAEDVSPADSYRAAEQIYAIGDNQPDAPTAAGSSAWAVVRMILSLALAAAAIYGVVYLVKRSSKKTVTDDPYLKILASANLGLNRYVHIVSVGSMAWLLGSGEGGVNLISEINEKEVLDAMLLDNESRNSKNKSGRFPDFFTMLRRIGIQPGNRNSSTSNSIDEIRKHRERLKQM